MLPERAASIDHLVIATVAGDQANDLTRRLTTDGFYVTQISSRRGLWEDDTVSLLIGLKQERLPALLGIIRTYCRPRRHFIPAQIEAPLLQIQPLMIEAETGGATIYVLDVERCEQF